MWGNEAEVRAFEVTDVEPDNSEVAERCDDCGAIAATAEQCTLCGAVLCAGCFEGGVGICRGCHTANHSLCVKKQI